MDPVMDKALSLGEEGPAVKSWAAEQSALNAAQFDVAVRDHYPAQAKYFEDPREFHRGLKEEWNYLDAVEKIDWNAALPPGAVCLDLGAGTGWLSSYLSKVPHVGKIYAVDSSRASLTTLFSGMQALMGADKSKIEPIEGFFSPLLLEDKSLDAVVASSSLHHAEHLEGVMREVRRVLKDEGTLFIVNELPLHDLGYLYVLAKAFAAILFRTIFRRYRSVSRAISSSGVLDDPYLGDRRYPYWYWRKAIEAAGFRIDRVLRTGLATRKNKPRDIELVHFICGKRAAP